MSGQQEYVVAERRVSATAVILVMLMVLVFLSVAMNFYYWQHLQELNTNLRILNQQLRGLQRDVQDLSKGLDAYRAVNALLELQMRSMVIKMLKEMGFSDYEIERLLGWFNVTSARLYGADK